MQYDLLINQSILSLGVWAFSLVVLSCPGGGGGLVVYVLFTKVFFLFLSAVSMRLQSSLWFLFDLSASCEIVPMRVVTCLMSSSLLMARVRMIAAIFSI